MDNRPFCFPIFNGLNDATHTPSMETYAQAYYKKNKERIIAHQLEYYRANRERYLTNFSRYNKAYHLAHYTPKPKKERAPKQPAPKREPAPKKEPKKPTPKKQAPPRKPAPPREKVKKTCKAVPAPTHKILPVTWQEPVGVSLIQRGHFELSFQ